jgi:hypothetical protein
VGQLWSGVHTHQGTVAMPLNQVLNPIEFDQVDTDGQIHDDTTFSQPTLSI